MNEEKIKGLEFGETVADGNGNKYTKTIGGWIYTNFAGNILLIPEPVVKENLTTEKAEKKAKEK